MIKKISVLILILTLAISFLIPVSASAWNKQLFDFTYDFNYAYIDLPGGKVVEGKVQSWTDFEDGDQLQIKINGITYLTDTTRAVLVYDPNLHN